MDDDIVEAELVDDMPNFEPFSVHEIERLIQDQVATARMIRGSGARMMGPSLSAEMYGRLLFSCLYYANKAEHPSQQQPRAKITSENAQIGLDEHD